MINRTKYNRREENVLPFRQGYFTVQTKFIQKCWSVKHSPTWNADRPTIFGAGQAGP
jgi:hypothetical protein